jgi:alcohol dehydrogenase class IV
VTNSPRPPIEIETLFNTVEQKRFYFPGRIVWGSGCKQRALELVAASGSVVLFVDAHFAEQPFAHALVAALGDRLRAREVIDGMPVTERIVAFAERTPPPEAVISLGGGSTADSAKAALAVWLYGHCDGIGMGALRGVAPLQGRDKPLLIGVPTTGGTGADASRYYVTYEHGSRRKVHGKSFRLIADWILVDPELLASLPEAQLIAQAFDTFVHGFESMIARGERSAFGEMLSLDAMVRVLVALDAVLREGRRGAAEHQELLYASVLGGMAISNVRTGNVHEAAGALLELTALSHPETLLVFFRSAYRQYRAEVEPLTSKLLARLRAERPALAFADFDALIDWWERAFVRAGAWPRIAGEVQRVLRDRERTLAHVQGRVSADRVWLDKESPRALSARDVAELVTESLQRFATGSEP